jgi:tol-pal system beta propeller repeat protein TolB
MRSRSASTRTLCAALLVGSCSGSEPVQPDPVQPPPELPASLSNRIVFTSNRTGFGLWTMQSDGSGVVRLPLIGFLHDTSPDGRRVAHTDAGQIRVANLDGTEPRTLTSQGRNVAPRWSPDGSKILFWSDRDGNPDVFVMHADGSNPVNLTRHPAEDLEATWSPDGTFIAFRSLRSGGGDIYVMNADGSNVRLLVGGPGQEANPRWSPDGNHIAFDSDQAGNFEIFVIRVDGTGLTRLSDHPDVDTTPSWSPDGRMLAFSTRRDGNFEVYVMNVDGTGLRNLTNHPANDGDVAWVR